MPLSALPRIDRLTLAHKTAVPAWHPEAGTFKAVPVHAWLVHHPDGLVLIDAGVGSGSDIIDNWYRHDVVELAQALEGLRIDPSEIAAVIVTHLHFDHCGQLNSLDAPVHVQALEHAAALDPRYTVSKWATVADRRLRLLMGDERIAVGLSVLATPGHTPGHQSVVIEGGGRRVVLAGQCAYEAEEVRTGTPRPTNLHDMSFLADATDSLARVRALRPAQVHLSHDESVVELR